MSRVRPVSTAGTLTVALEEAQPSSASSSSSRPSEQAPQTLVLRLKRPKKKVTWKEGTVDNEFLNRRSSKKCCIFHKEKSFDEDTSDDEDGAGSLRAGPHDDDGHSGPSHTRTAAEATDRWPFRFYTGP